jgi:hypothetical protein
VQRHRPLSNGRHNPNTASRRGTRLARIVLREKLCGLIAEFLPTSIPVVHLQCFQLPAHNECTNSENRCVNGPAMKSVVAWSLSLSVCLVAYPAHATTVSVFGTPGIDAISGSSSDGGPGGAATAVAGPNSDPTNNAIATGGTGGASGATGGPGGPATATAAGTATGNNFVFVSASAFGGSGGANTGEGGSATASATGTSDAGTLWASASATGGAGGDLDRARISPNRAALGVNGGTGAAANLRNAVSGSTTGSLYMYQSATGGAGGSGLSGGSFTHGGAGGDAVSTLTVNDNLARSIFGTVNASGGAGGNTTGFLGTLGSGGNGGNATANIALTSSLNGVNVRTTANATGGTAGTGPLRSGTAGTANAIASASAVGSGVASASSTAMGAGGGAATATSRSNGRSGQSVVASATSPVGGEGPASAMTQTSFGGAVSLPSRVNPGQSFSAINAFNVGPATVAFGSMGAGGIGASLTYQTSATFIFNAIGGGIFLIDPLSSFSLGSGFESALFQILLNDNIFASQSFNNLASARAFFSPSNLIDVSLAAGLNNIQLAFNETISGGQGFGFNYAAVGLSGAVSAAPLPPTWTMMLMGLVVLGLTAYLRQKKSSTGAAA